MYFLSVRRKSKPVIIRKDNRIKINSQLQEAFPGPTGASLGDLMPINQVVPVLSANYFLFFLLIVCVIFAFALVLLQLFLLNFNYQSSILSHQMSNVLKSDKCIFQHD